MRFRIPAILAICLSATAWADRIELIYGDVLEGQIVTETDTSVTIRGPFGEVTLPKNEVKTMQRDAAAAPQPSSPAPAAPPLQPAAPSAEDDPWGNPDDSAPAFPDHPAPSNPYVPPSAPPQQVAPPVGASSQPPAPYDLLKQNVALQSQWTDLEIAYLQRAYVGGQVVQTQFIGRVVPPHYFRSKLTTPIPASPQFPQGGEVEYDMYRARSMLYQVVKSPGQPIQYLKMDMARIPGLEAGDNPVESFHRGFIGAGTNEALLQTIARNSSIIGSENTEGHDCWVIETLNTPDLIEMQVARYDSSVQDSLRTQLSQLGRIRSWVGKEDLNQWRMENYSAQGDLLLSMRMIAIKPNQALTPQQLRMKVPKGTEFLDVTDMIASQFGQFAGMAPGVAPIPSPGDILGTPPVDPYQSAGPTGAWPGQPGGVTPMGVSGNLPQQGLPQPGYPLPGQSPYPVQQQSYTPPAQAPMPQTVPMTVPPRLEPGTAPAYPAAPAPSAPLQQAQTYYAPPAQGYPANVAVQPQGYAPMQAYPAQGYPQPQAGYPGQAGAFQQSYVQQGMPGMGQPPQGSGSSTGGGFLSRLFGGGRSGNTQPAPMMGGPNAGGSPTMMVPMVNGQPQFPSGMGR